MALLVQAITRIRAQIQVHEETLLTHPFIESYENLRLLFDITGWPTHIGRITYSELKDVIEGFSAKMIHEGFVGLSRFPAPLSSHSLSQRTHNSTFPHLIELPNNSSHLEVLTP